jgi:uncharacterized protein (TIGR03083 family)
VAPNRALVPHRPVPLCPLCSRRVAIGTYARSSHRARLIGVNDPELFSSLVADVVALASVLASSPEAQIVHCPGWNVADLIRHHGGVLRWSEAIVRSGEPALEEYAAPEDANELRGWYVESAHAFIATASNTDRDRACWTFGRSPERVWFWIRRQALEAAVHRWDAEFAMGAAPTLAPDLACLGISEVVEDLFPRQVDLGRTPGLSGGLQLRAVDLDQRWLLPATDTEASDAVLEAEAPVLLLFLWRRTDLHDPRIRFSGPPAMHDELQAARLAP